MINKSKWFLIAFVMLASGCAMFQWRKAEIYPMSFDQTYDVVMSALDDMEPWRLIQTDHKRGLIVIGYETYLGPEKELQFLLERVEPFRTKVQLNDKRATPFTQKFFKAIDRRVEERALTYPS